MAAIVSHTFQSNVDMILVDVSMKEGVWRPAATPHVGWLTSTVGVRLN